MSPLPGVSTLITRAPKSASSVEASGPASACERSRTVMSSRAPPLAMPCSVCETLLDITAARRMVRRERVRFALRNRFPGAVANRPPMWEMANAPCAGGDLPRLQLNGRGGAHGKNLEAKDASHPPRRARRSHLRYRRPCVGAVDSDREDGTAPNASGQLIARPDLRDT